MSDIVRACRRTWRRLGVRRADVREMTAELEADLAAAAGEGVHPTELVGHDPRAFALSWAREKGVAGPRALLASTALATLVGALPGVAIGLLIAYGNALSNLEQIARGYLPNDPAEVWSPPEWLLFAVYVLAALVTYAGALAAVSAVLRWRLDPAAGATVRLLAWALPVIIPLAIGATVVFAATQGFSTDRLVVAGDLLVPAFALAVSVAAVRLHVVRRTSEAATSSPAVLGETVA
jgi:hypothetical protein